MANEIDLRALSNFSSLSEAVISSVLDAPTIDSVKSLLKAIEQNAKECEQSKSQRVKLEVELETVVRTNESKVKVLQNSRDKALADVQKLRTELQTSETNRSKVEADLEQFRNTATSEASEAASLRSRISSLEASNRDTLALFESKTNAYEKLSQDLSAQHQKAVELRKNITALEQSVQAANSSASSFKFKEQSLQQEIDLLKKNNEWLESERKIKAEEHTNFRKEKNARIAELTRSNEHYISEADASRKAESSLKHRLEELKNKCEDAMQAYQTLNDEKISEVNAVTAELDNVKRLQELQQESAEMAQKRVKQLNEQLGEKDDEFAEQIGQLRAAAESDHEDKEAAEQKITELEARLYQLQSELEEAQARPSTPQHPVISNGTSTPARPSTPAGIFSPSSASRLRGNVSMTQMFTEYKKLEKELAAEKRTNQDLQENLDSMVQQLEGKQPELEQIQADHARSQRELLDMSDLLDQANQARDAALREARNHQGQLSSKTKEVEVLRQQLRDLGVQIRYLLMEQEVQRRGESLSRHDFEQMQKFADEAMERDAANLSQTQRMVNDQLIIFKNISELQEQNQSQLATIRNLVANLERTESEDRQQKFHQGQQDLEAANVKMASMQDEIQNLMTQCNSFVQERDLFRKMLTRKGHYVDPKDFSRSMPAPAAASPSGGLDESVNGASSQLKELVNALQQQLDMMRNESASTHSTLKAQIDNLSKRNAELQAEASRAQGYLSAANQRNEMMQANIDITKGDNAELQKRNYTLMENATKQDMKTQQVAEEAVEARSLIDSLRRESANLKAEKDLWKSVEKRLLEDNESLRNERGRVDQMNNSLQNLLNEREQADSETRRRLQSQAESLEIELQSAKRKLNDEMEESRKTALRREYEQEQSQRKIDDLMTSLSSTREELVAAKTSRDHLQARADELAVELRSAEERVEVLSKPAESSGDVNGTDENAVSKEQELAIEVSELKRDLELKQSELDRLNEQIEVYKSISQSSEERLQEVAETNDQYREETEAAIAEKDAKIKDLEHRIEDISSELNTTNSALSKLRDEQSESNRKLEEQKTSYEAEIARLKELEEKYAEQAQFNLETTKEQGRIAIEAQQRYEEEVVKHGEAAKLMQTVRSEANQLRLEMVDLRSQANSAQTSLQQRESSWSDMKNRYEQEITDLKKRREEVQQQNTLLHSQLEKLTQQISSLQQDRAALAEGDAAESSNGSLDNLQEVIKYLRREKEIVDVQYHLSMQEAKRLRQQLDFTKTRLDETQLKLDQQRIAEVDSQRNAVSHTKLMEALNELNLFRESSVTLRSEAKQAQQALAEKTKRVEELEAQIQPLSAKVAELEHLAELRDGEMKLLQNDRDQWRDRTQNILSKYDRVDPTEIEAMKEHLSALKTERDEAAAARDGLQTQVDGIPDQVKAGKDELRERLQDQFKTKMREQTGKFKEKQAEVDELTKEKKELTTELDFVREQLESARNHSATTPAAQINGDAAKSPGEGATDSSERVIELETRLSELESKSAEKVQELAALQSSQDAKYKAKEDELKSILNKRLAEVKQEKEGEKKAELEQLEQRLRLEYQTEIERLTLQHQKEMDDLRAQSSSATEQAHKPSESELQAPPALAMGEPSNEVLENLDPEKAKYIVQKNKHVNQLVSNNIRKRVDAVKKEYEEKLAAAGEGRGELSAQEKQELEEKFAAEKEALIQGKEAEFASQKETLENEFNNRLDKEKQALIAKYDQEKLQAEEESKKKIAQHEEMVAKKNQFQLNNMKKINAQLTVVKKAVEDTPEKAVSEVWTVAKDAKPAPIQTPKPVVITAPATPSKTETAGSTTSAIPAASAATPEVTKQAEPPTTDGSHSQPEQQAIPNGPTKPNTGTAPGPLKQLQSGLPRSASSSIARGGGGGGGGSRGGAQNVQQPSAGRGSTLPQARGAYQARGRGITRGGHPGAANNALHALNAGRGGGQLSPRASLNPGAPGFVPAGSKRPREEGEGDGGLGKRIRGGGQGGS